MVLRYIGLQPGRPRPDVPWAEGVCALFVQLAGGFTAPQPLPETVAQVEAAMVGGFKICSFATLLCCAAVVVACAAAA
eukprot:9094817-Lingulodinium_polyedra.AAC.1